MNIHELEYGEYYFHTKYSGICDTCGATLDFTGIPLLIKYLGYTEVDGIECHTLQIVYPFSCIHCGVSIGIFYLYPKGITIEIKENKNA